MKRRQAIKNLVIITSAAAILPGCKTEPNGTVYENVSLDGKQRQFLVQFTDAMLPKAKTGVTMPETTTDFIMTILNDCTSPADIQKFKAGLTELQAYSQQKYKAEFGSLGEEKKAEIFGYLSSGEGVSEVMKFYYGTTRGLTIEHFTSSEFFMKNITKWEFAPGYFKGCVAVG